jgi:hypothetical protein
MRKEFAAQLTSARSRAFEPKWYSEFSFTTEDMVWAQPIFEFQLVSLKQGDVSATVTPFACGEIRLSLEEDITMIGLPVDSAPGDDLSKKLANLRNIADKFNVIVARHGAFSVTVPMGSAIALPPCYLVLQVAAQECSYLKWGTLTNSSTDAKAIRALLEDMMELGGDTAAYKSFIQYLDLAKLASKHT